MADQRPFDPGGPSPCIDLTAEDDEPDEPVLEPITNQIRNRDDSGTPHASRYRASTFPYPSNQGFEYGQHAQTFWSHPTQVATTPSLFPYSLQAGSYYRQPYDVTTHMPYGGLVPDWVVTPQPPVVAAHQNNTPAATFPYWNPVLGGGPFKFQERPPIRNDFRRRGATICKTSSQGNTRTSPVKKRQENFPSSPSKRFPPSQAHANVAFQPDGLIIPAPQAVEITSADKRLPQSAARPRTVSEGQTTSLNSASVQILSNDQEEDSQGKLICNLAKPNVVINVSAHQVFDEEQCDKILWLALHGIPSRAIGWLIDIRRPASMSRPTVVASLDKLIKHFIPELAKGQGYAEEPDALVDRLLRRGDDLDWSGPYLLRRAVDFTSIPEGDVDEARKERRNNARERRALQKWVSEHDENPGEGTFQQRNRNAVMARRGLVRDTDEKEAAMKRFGYREGSHEAEKPLMKKWLLKIRELGKLPDRLDEDGIPGSGDQAAAEHLGGATATMTG